MNVCCGNVDIAALIDTGSSINIMSAPLYKSLPRHVKSDISRFTEPIKLANGQLIFVEGTSSVTIQTNQGLHEVKVYILSTTSHPLILGMEYLKSSNITLKFSEFNTNSKYHHVKCNKRLCIQPNSEIFVRANVPKHLSVGLQGICTNNVFSLGKGLLLAKALVTVSIDKTIPLKIMNPTNTTISVSKGSILANFQILNADFSVITEDIKCPPVVQNVQIGSTHPIISTSKNNEFRDETKTVFLSNFSIPEPLNPEQTTQLTDCLYENKDIFVTKENPDLGFSTYVQHKINLKPDVKPKHQQPYRLPPTKREVLRHHLDELLKQGIIAPISEEENVPITSPIVLVTKRKRQNDAFQSEKDAALSQYRFCCDFRYLNSCTEQFKYFIPNLQELTESFSQFVPNYISSIDLSSGFFQLGIDPESSRYTAFNTCFGLKLGPKKCSFAQSSCIFLGHSISKEGVSPPPDRVQAIQEYPPPKNIKELRRLIGMLNWFRKFIPNFSAKYQPLTRLLKKGQFFVWNVEQQSSFNDLKYALLNSKILAFPNYDLTFRLAVDTSSRGIGYMLYQMHPNVNGEEQPRVIRFGSKSLSRWQQSYGPTKLELLGMVVSILDCADYLRGNKFVVECDHQALRPIFQKQFKGAIYERWMAILQQFNFDLQYKPAEQMQVADALSRCTRKNDEPVISPDEDDPFFPYVTERTGQIKLPSGRNLADFLHNSETESATVINVNNVNNIDIFSECVYDADTDDVLETPNKKKKTKLNKKCETVNVTQVHNNDSLYDKSTDQCSDKIDIFDISTVYDTPSDNNFDKPTQNHDKYVIGT
ncbi:unnamed protein product [Mytilus edulis]|uniref:Reverse transcriptase/retrotransposon-derived protein RNase H-like domain-containing protein n=1 Tax=Mytilus edulis TaxID=6550 RepID=A0A8S3SAL0_MYTED|nr:unnamed protein product [Mytilus edulis]